MRNGPLLALCLGVACAPPHAAEPYPTAPVLEGEPTAVAPSAPSDVVRYFDREIGLAPFLTGFPYGAFFADLEHRRLFFLDKRDRYTLRMAELSETGAPDLSAARAVSDVDWAGRSLFDLRYHAGTDAAYLLADERNDEQLNVWTLALADGRLEQLTRSDYVYGFGWSSDERTLAYLGRQGKQAPFTTCLRTIDLGSRQEREIVCDRPELAFTWGRPTFSPDGREIYFAAQTHGDRNRVQIVRVDLGAERPVARPVTDPRRLRSGPQLIEGWVDDDLLLFTANDDGWRNLHAYSRRRGKVRQLTSFEEDVDDAVLTAAGVFLAHGTPAGTTLELVDPRTGKRHARGGVTGSVSVLDGHGQDVVWSQTAPDLVFELDRTRVSAEGTEFHNERLVGVAPEVERTIVACRARAVKIPTFDRDPETGETRRLHAFVLEPREPAPESQRRALVRAFYGGDNRYDVYDQILCAAGLTVISAAVRGSAGFGKIFAGLNDRDLGGNEIVDLFQIARWTESEFGFPAARIGVYGRSHGGYATMRALTFPAETNGGGEPYRFGFGLAEAGFSDILAFHEHTNIPDWVVLESGDPAVPADKARMAERSPINHVERLAVPLFLLHGANDWRVPVDGSREFAHKAETLGKSVTYVEVEGQGHHVEGLERIVAAWQSRLDFLMGLPGDTPPG